MQRAPNSMTGSRGRFQLLAGKPIAAMAYAAVLCIALTVMGCASSLPKTNTAPDLYPTALLAEPIKLRAGYEHVTQPFEIEGPEQSWSVELGLERHDDPQKANGTSPATREFFCLATSRKDMVRTVRKCANTEPGIHVRWELIDNQGISLGGATYDALTQDTGGTFSIASITVALQGFSGQPKGIYRLKVTVLRDFPQLDANSPHILVNRPFFPRH